MAFFAVYDGVEQLYEEYNLLKLNGKCGVYNALENEMIIPYKYDDIECIMYKSKFAETSEYLSHDKFTGYFRVKYHGNYGLCDKQGNEILPCNYDDIAVCVPNMDCSFSYCIIRLGSKCGIYNLIHNKNIIDVYSSDFDEIQAIMFFGTFQGFDYEDFSGYFQIGKNKNYGLCDYLGNIIIPCNYVELDISDGGNHKTIISVDKKFGIYNSKERRMIIPCKYDNIQAIYAGVVYSNIIENVWVLQNNGKYGLHDLNGEILPCQFDEIEPVTKPNSDDTDEEFADIFQLKQNNKIGLCDKNGHVIIPCAYDSISEKNSFWEVESHGKYGIYTKEDNNIIPCIYDEICSVKTKIYKSLQTNNCDTFGEMINVYNVCDCSSQYLVKIVDKYGIYDIKQNREIIPCQYMDIKFAVKKYNYRQIYTKDEYDVKIDYYKCLINNQWIKIIV